MRIFVDFSCLLSKKTIYIPSYYCVFGLQTRDFLQAERAQVGPLLHVERVPTRVDAVLQVGAPRGEDEAVGPRLLDEAPRVVGGVHPRVRGIPPAPATHRVPVVRRDRVEDPRVIMTAL